MCRDTFENRSVAVFFGAVAAIASLARLSSLSTRSHASIVPSKCFTPLSPTTSDLRPPCASAPLDTNATCVIHGSMPSKMCVAYTTVAPRSSHSDFKNSRRSNRPRMSKSTVISSQRRTLNGLRSPMQICTRLRWPSETFIMLQSRSMSRSWTRRARRSGSTSSTPKIILPAVKSPASATEPALPMVRRHCDPRYPRSPLHVSSISWNGGFPMTRTASRSTIVFPARI
mmetsp:Transcript_7770/g.28367  ORF Transcript_7770/g.28367 Transcript_7770/m.28367 type:complete len:228 (-) Transcript_7770:238-921(-)